MTFSRTLYCAGCPGAGRSWLLTLLAAVANLAGRSMHLPMPGPKIRFFLPSVAAANGHCVIYLGVGVEEKRPVCQATGYAAHPAYLGPKALHLLKGADGYRSINGKLDELRLAVAKACRRLEDGGQLSNAAFAPLPKAAVAKLAGQPGRAAKSEPVTPPAPSTLPLARQPLRAICWESLLRCW